MVTHIIAYEGRLLSLALMQKGYGPEYLPWPNERTRVNGTSQRPPYSLQDFEEWVDRLQKDKGHNEVFAVLVHEGTSENRTYRYIGNVGIHDITWPGAFGETGSILGAPGVHGKGYGTEAKLLIQYHAFNVLGLRKLCSSVKAFNAASLGHLLKCGYRIVGRHKAHDFHEGSFVDVILLECFREDWEPIWDAYTGTKTVPRLSAKQRKRVQKETS